MTPTHLPESASAARRKRHRTAVRILAIAATLALAVPVTYVSWRSLNPPQGERRPVDAIISLAPYYDRLPVSYALFQEGLAPELVVSWAPSRYDGTDSRFTPDQQEYQLCAVEGAANVATGAVTCFRPEPSTTMGEVFAINRLAAERDWESITVVTSSFHAFRTKFILDRCLSPGLDAELIYSEPDLNPAEWIWRVAYENLAMVKAWVQTSTECG